jgi:hypothetical protein
MSTALVYCVRSKLAKSAGSSGHSILVLQGGCGWGRRDKHPVIPVKAEALPQMCILSMDPSFRGDDGRLRSRYGQRSRGRRAVRQQVWSMFEGTTGGYDNRCGQRSRDMTGSTTASVVNVREENGRNTADPFNVACEAHPVIPAKAGIHTEYARTLSMDPRFRGDDGYAGVTITRGRRLRGESGYVGKTTTQGPGYAEGQATRG